MALKHPATFDSIKCDDLQYVNQAQTWVCMDIFMDLDDPEFCMRCKFRRLLEKEAQIKKELNGRRKPQVLRLG